MPLELEKVFEKIIPFITLKKSDKKIYVQDFKCVLEHIIELICSDNVFRKLYVGYNIGGSYADDLKILKPDEFDTVFELQLPYPELIKVECDNVKPGYCLINILNIINKLNETKENESIKNYLLNVSSNGGYLMQNKITEWFVNIMTNLLENTIPGGAFNKHNKKYTIKQRASGPAVTLHVNEYELHKFSIDLVPAFIFNQSHWIAKRECPANVKAIKWIAIPKPLKDRRNSLVSKDSLAFLTSYVDLERYLFINKQNLKITLKLMKKIRDRRDLNDLKSYFIKTVFLWKIDKNLRENINNDEFWQQSVKTLILIMFQELISFFEARSLPFYWNSSFDMLKKLPDQQITNLTNKLKSIYRMLINFDTKMDEDKIKIYEYFLDRFEIEEIGGKMSNEIKKRKKRALENRMLNNAK